MGKLRVLDLFSGIGGFSLGLERTGGFKTIGFCEIDPFCRHVLAKHWPEVPCHDDITTMQFEEGMADVITGGFPCQDISLAGKGAGLSGERSGLWRELVRAIRMVRPRYAIVENSPGLLNRGFGDILRDLAAVGFNAEWGVFTACMWGLPHTRARLYLLAYADDERKETGRREGNGNGAPLASRRVGSKYLYPAEVSFSCSRGQEAAREPELARVADGISHRVERNSALGNAVVPQIPELIGRAILEASAE